METSAALKDQGAGMMVPILVLFNSPVWSLWKPNKFCKISVYYHELNQVVASIASITLTILYLLEQININPGTWFVAINLRNVYFSFTIRKEDQK